MCLADIYRDVHEGLVLWEMARPEQAVWEWRFGYWSHWGAHLVEALSAIYSWQRTLASITRRANRAVQPPATEPATADCHSR